MVAVGRALMALPKVLALDEPSAGLDPRARRGLIDLLLSLPQTMLVSTHDMRLVAEVFPRLVLLADGTIVYDGATIDALKDAALLDQHGLESPM